MSSTDGPEPAILLEGVGLRRDGRSLLADITWRVDRGDRWVVLGPNGSGKSTLLSIAAMSLHPTTGSVTVLGERLGRTDVRLLRSRIGVSSAGLADQLRPALRVTDLVMAGIRGELETWWHDYDEDDRRMAADALREVGADHLARRTFGTLSSGERKRVQLARVLVADPDVLLLDEPSAGLDLGSREDLLSRLSLLAETRPDTPVVLVTHHVEEIPTGTTHCLLLRDGRIVSGGPIEEALDAGSLGDAFGLPVLLRREGGRWSARAA